MTSKRDMASFLLGRQFSWWNRQIGETWREEISRLRIADDESEIVIALLREHSGDELLVALVPDRDIFEPTPPEACIKETLNAAVRVFLDLRNEIERLPHRELQARYLSERQIELREYDEAAFFSESNAAPDYAYWRRLDSWTPEEATALSFGRDPARVNPQTLLPFGSVGADVLLRRSPFVKDFHSRLDLVKRAIAANVLKPAIGAGSFVKWASQKGIAVPSELSQHEPRAMDGRLLTSLRKVLLGLAISKYGYQRSGDSEERLRICGEISRDLLSAGVELGAQAIERHLKEAAATIPISKG